MNKCGLGFVLNWILVYPIVFGLVPELCEISNFDVVVVHFCCPEFFHESGEINVLTKPNKQTIFELARGKYRLNSWLHDAEVAFYRKRITP